MVNSPTVCRALQKDVLGLRNRRGTRLLCFPFTRVLFALGVDNDIQGPGSNSLPAKISTREVQSKE